MADSIAKAGHIPVAIDCFGDQDLISKYKTFTLAVDQFPQGAISIIDQDKYDGWIYGGGIENHPEFISELSNTIQLYATPADVVRNVRDPFYLKSHLTQYNLATPSISFDFPNNTGFNWIGKQYHSGGGRHVNDIDLSNPPADYKRYDYFQEKVNGTETSAVYVTENKNTQLIGTTKQLTGIEWLNAPSQYAYCGNIISPGDQRGNLSTYHKFGSAVGKLGMNGIWGIDFIETYDGNLYAIEVNPRYTASVELFELDFSHNTHAIKAIYYSPETFCYSPQIQTDLTNLATAENIDILDIPHANSTIERGQPMLSLITMASSDNQCIARLTKFADTMAKLIDTRKPERISCSN